MRLCPLIITLLFCLFSTTKAANTQTSKLWGEAGETWQPDSRLPDFSYAGYQRGEQPLPVRQPEVSVKDFGALGDGQTDDSEAIQRAVTQAAGKCIAFPPGRYVLTEIIEIKSSNTILQGAGPGQTVIVVPKPLESIRPNLGATTSGRPTSRYSWSGGIIWAKGKLDQQVLSKVAVSAHQGENSLTVERPERFQVGDYVRLEMNEEPNFSLTSHLYADDPGDIENLKRVRETWLAKVIRVDLTTKQIEFDRSLRTDVRLIWQPHLYPARSTVEEIGIENLTFEFPVTPYHGHFTELGYNAIEYKHVYNSWIRNIEILHADSGIHVSGANITITGLVFKSDRKRDDNRNSTGHHAVTLGGTDQLLRDFDIQTKFIHDITQSRGSTGNVSHNGRGEDLTFDHHKYANHSNLYTNIDAGEGTNIFRSGGGAKLGRHSGAKNTWWNIHTRRPVSFPTGWTTDYINIVGVASEEKTTTTLNGRWFEVITPSNLHPADLYQSQLNRRLQKNP